MGGRGQHGLGRQDSSSNTIHAICFHIDDADIDDADIDDADINDADIGN
jgi:hypothetical protein